MISKGTEGLFNRVIIQSAPFGIMCDRNKITDALLKEAAKTSIDGSTENVVLAQSRIAEKGESFGLKSSMPFGVQYGHYPLPNEENIDEAWEKNALHVEVLVGSNSHEVASFIPLIPEMQILISIPILGNLLLSVLIKWLTG